MFAFSGEDGKTIEGSGFTALLLPHKASTSVYSFDLGDARLDATFHSNALSVVTSDVVATNTGDVVTYAAWDMIVGTAQAIALSTLRTTGGGASTADTAVYSCNFTGSWRAGSRKPYTVVEHSNATFSARAASARSSWHSAHGSVNKTMVSITFDIGKVDHGTFTPDCGSITWQSSGGGVWTRNVPPKPLPPGVECSVSGSFALCQADSPGATSRFAVVFGSSGGASVQARAAAACANTSAANVEAVATARLSRLATLPNPPPRPHSPLAFGDAMLSKKVYSTMRVNTLSAEGTAPVHWSTPDKTPHQAMWLWDSCFHAIGRAAAANARTAAGTAQDGKADVTLAWEYLYSMLSNAAPDGPCCTELQLLISPP
jgi:hypothetical protein